VKQTHPENAGGAGKTITLRDSTIALEVETLLHYLAYDSTFILVLPRVQKFPF
jgi:hypothetical protein